MDHKNEFCRNCRTPLHGQYCSNCGQREGRPDIRFSEAAGELLGEMFERDSRLWNTLFNLLFRPGFLPAEFIAGRRARYVPPFRLYLIISFLLFLVLSVGTKVVLLDEASRPTEVTGESVAPEKIEGEINIQLGTAPDQSPGQQSATVSLDIVDEDSPQWLQNLEQRAEGNIERLEDDPGPFIDALMEYLPQMMFLLLPLFALLLRLCYLLSPFHYLQHLVFAFYLHCFVYLAYLAGVLLEYLDTHADGFLFFVTLAYLFIALKRTYGSGIAGALGKSAFIVISYTVMLTIGFALVAVLALSLM